MLITFHLLRKEVRKIKTLNKFKPDQCRYFEFCNAPLCPLDEKHLKTGTWYPDEDICRLRKITDWIKLQKKITKKTKDKDTYYSYEMLNRNCKVGTGMTGLNPNKPEEPQLEEWLKKHPQKTLSEKQKNNLVEARKKGHTIKV